MMKTCPFCAEEIQDEAIKCRWCGEFLDDSALRRRSLPPSAPPPLPDLGEKWHERTSTLILATVIVGPFAIPLILRNQRLNPAQKFWFSAVVLAFTGLLIWISIELASRALEIVRQLTAGSGVGGF